MHELSLVCSICDVVNKKVAECGADRVVQIKIIAGDLSGIEDFVLKSCFEMLAQTTKAEGAELIIEHLPVKVRCRKCGNEYESGIPFLKCAKCQNESIEIISGTELYIDSISVE
ncbi:MAG: hydrogenase maturation nickel metallochaperone HypA [Oscillospiraceae bacterium]